MPVKSKINYMKNIVISNLRIYLSAITRTTELKVNKDMEENNVTYLRNYKTYFTSLKMCKNILIHHKVQRALTFRRMSSTIL